jgi:hypothetical protein
MALTHPRDLPETVIPWARSGPPWRSSPWTPCLLRSPGRRKPVPRGLATSRPQSRGMRGVPLLRAPRTLALAEVDALLTNRDRAIARIRLKFADDCTSVLHLA